MTKINVLLIEDEANIRQFIRITLHAEGMQCIESSCGEDGLKKLHHTSPHIVILDLGLPDTDGYYVLRKIRAVSDVPVLILTARSDESEKVKLFMAGANDYLVKPFGIQEFIIRIKVLLRDINYTPSTSELSLDRLKLNTDTRKVILDNEVIKLTKKEYAILSVLAEQAGKFVSQQSMLSKIWGINHEYDTHYLRVHITALRKKLKDSAECPTFIETLPGIGYRHIND